MAVLAAFRPVQAGLCGIGLGHSRTLMVPLYSACHVLWAAYLAHLQPLLGDLLR